MNDTNIILTIIYTAISTFGTFITIIVFFSGKQKFLDFKLLARILFLPLLLISFYGAYKTTVKLKESESTNQTSLITSIPYHATSRNKIQQKPLDTSYHQPDKIYNKGITRIFIDSTQHNTNNDGQEGNAAVTSEKLPPPGYALLIVRTLTHGHYMYYTLDKYREFMSQDVWDTTTFYPQENKIYLTPQPHHLIFKDQFGAIDSLDILLKPGDIYIKYLKHPYPFGEKIGKLKIIPKLKNKIREIAIHFIGTDSVITCTLKNHPLSFLLPEGEYDCDVTPLNPGPREHKTSEREEIGAGHVTSFPVY